MKQQVEVLEQTAAVEDFIRLRQITGLSPRPRVGVEKALPNSLYGVQLVFEGECIAMARVVGDGAINFEVVDVAVDPHWQGQGLGRLLMQKVMDYLKAHAFEGAYITLMADVPQLYLKFGFSFSSPASEGMYLVWPPKAELSA